MNLSPVPCHLSPVTPCHPNTRRLNIEETKAKIASLEYIQNELSK